MSDLDQAIDIIRRISVDDKLLMLGYLRKSLQKELTQDQFKHLSWGDFLDLSYGLMADNPMEERPPFSPPEQDAVEAVSGEVHHEQF